MLVAAVIGGVIAFTNGDDEEAGNPAEHVTTAGTSEETSAGTTATTTESTTATSTNPATDLPSDPTEVTATPTTAPSAEADLDTALANLQRLTDDDAPECPFDDALYDRLSASMKSRFVDRVLRAGTPASSVGLRERRTGASTLVCSVDADRSSIAVIVGALGTSDFEGWLDATFPGGTDLGASNDAEDGRVYPVGSSTDLFSLKGAIWTDDQLAVMVGGVAIDGKPDIRTEAAVEAVTGSVDTVISSLATMEPEPAPETTTTLPSSRSIDSSPAVARINEATRVGLNETIECPVSPDVLDAFNEPLSSRFVAGAIDETPILGASVWLRQKMGPTGLRCSTSGQNGLVAIYLGNVGGAGLEGWLRAMDSAFPRRQLGTNRGGTVYAVNETDGTSDVRGALWTDGKLVVMIAGLADPGRLDFSPDDAAGGLMAALQPIIDELSTS